MRDPSNHSARPGAHFRAKIRPVSFHALRHTAATLALEDGQPPHVVAAMLGHANVATTLRLYAHVTHASTEALVDAIDARFGPRLRVLPEEVLDQYWTRKVEIGATGTKSDCRGRESNPPKLPQNDRKKRRPNSRERPGSAT
jgi:hypothetical protein